MPWLPSREAQAATGLTERTLQRRATLDPSNPLYIKRRFTSPGNTRSSEYLVPDGQRGAARAGGVEMQHRASGRGHAEVEVIRRVLDEDARRFPEPEPMLQDDDGEEPIEDLIARRRAAFLRTEKASTQRVHVIRRDGPFAVCYLGDPHLDDDGCNWPALERDVSTIKNTPGMYALNVGDTINNWVGFLVREYRNQSSTEKEAFRLARWLLFALAGKWDGVILGNHDGWNQGEILFMEYAKQAGLTRIQPDEIAIEYQTRGDPIRTLSRHFFPGSSMWHPTHGPLRWATMHPGFHVYAQGHTHQHGGIDIEDDEGRHVLCLVVRGYKFFDKYARSKGFKEYRHGCSTTVVFDPEHPHPFERAKKFADVEEAADWLRYVQGRR